jgi:hypothetical protein
LAGQNYPIHEGSFVRLERVFGRGGAVTAKEADLCGARIKSFPRVRSESARHSNSELPMKAVIFLALGDIRLEDVSGPRLREPTDAIVRLTHRRSAAQTSISFAAC